MTGTFEVILILFFFSYSIIITTILSFLIYNIYIKITKIHNIVSINSIELDKINNLVIGEESSFAIMKDKIEGVHDIISTEIVKILLKENDKK